MIPSTWQTQMGTPSEYSNEFEVRKWFGLLLAAIGCHHDRAADKVDYATS